MKSSWALIGIGCALIVNAPALAGDVSTLSAANKRQIVHCMIKRMYADRTISYNDAARLCKELVDPDKAPLASNNPVVAGSAVVAASKTP